MPEARFDKFVGNEFERAAKRRARRVRPRDGPNNPVGRAKNTKATLAVVFVF